MWWAEWWVWAAFGLGLVILEIMAPGYVFLGFGIGAGVMGLAFWIGVPVATAFVGSWAWTAAGFAIVSLIAWITLRSILGVTKSQVKTFDEDINDN